MADVRNDALLALAGELRCRRYPIRGRHDDVDCVADDLGQRHGLHVEPHLAGHDSRHVEDILAALDEVRGQVEKGRNEKTSAT